MSREIFKTHPLSKISIKKTAPETLDVFSTLDARKLSSSTEKTIGNSDVKEDHFWKESERFRVSTKSETATLPMMSSAPRSSDGLGIPDNFDLNFNKNNVGVTNIQMVQSDGVYQCPIQSSFADIRHTTLASASLSSSMVDPISNSSDSHTNMTNAGGAQPAALEEGGRVEFEGRPFFFVDIE
jgi:hypothetical protein